MNNYTILHLHTTLSNAHINIDSITHYYEYIDMAKKNNMKAITFTEHGNILEWVKKKEYAESKGLKYIHGVEAYITETLEEKIRDNYHCILLAKNKNGVKELNKLVSISNDEMHKYYVPRISIEELEKTSNNIIILTACLGGILNKAELSLQRKFLQFLIRNKKRCFLEIQHHNVEDQINYNRKLYKISQKCGLKLVAGTDTHALDQKQMRGRKVLQKAKDVKFADEENWDLTFKTYNELVDAFKKQRSLPMNIVLEAIENTNVIANSIEDFDLDKSYKYPHLWDNPEEIFKEAIKKGVKDRKIYTYSNYEEYKKRICDEFKTYKANGAIDFMLLMYDIVRWCKDNDIQIGYGRGSVNGSLIAYLLGITEMDSIKFNLNFSRFMNPERISLADIDTDFPPSRINEVKNYVFNHHGLYCCDIVTFNTIADKGAIRDVCRGLYKDSDKDYLKLANEICDNFELNEEQMRIKYPDVFEYVDLVKGTVVSIGNHPCGMVCSPFDITEWFGTISTSNDPLPISQINMKEIDSLNFVKLDLLKLDTIEVITKTCKYANISMITPDNVDASDNKVWDSIRENTVSIFQWEGSLGDKYIKKLLSDNTIGKFQKLNKNVDKMTLLSIGNSAIRPAGASYREDLASGNVRKIGSKPIDDFLSDTFGFLCFQEQIIEFLHKYCGFTMGQADIIRRGFAKKTGTEQYIPIIKNGGSLNGIHINGYIKTMKDMYDIPEEKSEEDITAFLKVIEDASNYLFSLNHSQPYSYMGYVEGYLRYYYPLEFLTAALNVNQDNETKTIELTKYAKQINVKIEQPKFRKTKDEYFYDKSTNAIYKGLKSVKFMNDKVAKELFDLRNNQYDDFVSLYKDLKEKTSLNKRQIEILIKVNFFIEFGNNKRLLQIYELCEKLYARNQLKKSNLYQDGLSELVVKKYSKKETEKLFKNIDAPNLIRELSLSIKDKKLPVNEQIKNELEYLGYINYINEDIEEDYYIVIQLLNSQNKKTPLIRVRRIKDGKEQIVKIKMGEPINENDSMSIIRVDQFSLTPKYRYEGKDDKGKSIYQKTGEMIEVIDAYRLIK